MFKTLNKFEKFLNHYVPYWNIRFLYPPELAFVYGTEKVNREDKQNEKGEECCHFGA